MMTLKEIKFLNLLYKLFKGHPHTQLFVTDYIILNFKLKDSVAFEYGYMYAENFWDANGDFKNVVNPKRMSYEEYLKKIPIPMQLVMKVEQMKGNNDKNISHYVVNDNGYNVDYYEYGNLRTEYTIFEDTDDIIGAAWESTSTDDLCDPQNFGEWSRKYFFITDEKKETFAKSEAETEVSLMSSEDILTHAADYLSDSGQRNVFRDALSTTEKTEEYDQLVERAKKYVVSDLTEAIFNEIVDDPALYFINNQNIFTDEYELYMSGLVGFRCGDYIRDYLDSVELQELVQLAGYSEYEIIKGSDNKYYYVVWN